ncbi:hypothetical protein WKI71_15495 [Streptomyces sp. MS1.AVA.1]|uniref:Bile acid:sodium symporter n=1 Tax=Streptomyces machairae TaxID=3134109 RepID=A0ABU8ULF8_9ACTN
MTTPIWKMVRWPLPIALGLAMAGTVTPEIGDDLDLQRVLQFLPYFVLGLIMKAEHFHMVRTRTVRMLSVPVGAVALAFAWWAVPRMNTAWSTTVTPRRSWPRRGGAGRSWCWRCSAARCC